MGLLAFIVPLSGPTRVYVLTSGPVLISLYIVKVPVTPGAMCVDVSPRFVPEHTPPSDLLPVLIALHVIDLIRLGIILLAQFQSAMEHAHVLQVAFQILPQCLVLEDHVLIIVVALLLNPGPHRLRRRRCVFRVRVGAHMAMMEQIPACLIPVVPVNGPAAAPIIPLIVLPPGEGVREAVPVLLKITVKGPFLTLIFVIPTTAPA